VCATGKSSEELLALLDARLSNDPQTEIVVAAGEQRKIIALRLRKLVTAAHD
jgi:2-oxo-4-hydroxy-4-carboxy-5-ureidoimidazoline decarboxylase